jgi:hypothetical protein
MESLADIVFPRRKKRRILFETAIESSNQIQNLYKLFKEGDFKTDLSQTAFTKVFPHDPNSPAIFWINENQLIIRYPPNSTPYNHSFKNKCKFVECLSGIIYDKNNENFRLFPGDGITVEPNNTLMPYTEKEPCYLRVCIGDCNSLFDQICK